MVAETIRLNSSLDGNSKNVDSPECRTCRSTHTILIGHLPDVYEFAGRMYPRPLIGGSLWRCGACHFTFRHPIYDEAAYADLYRSGSVQVWESDLRREDLRLVSQRIERGGFINVLDVGCYTGKLLSMLPSRCKLHGIEVNRAAARIAAERGVSIVAHTFEDFEQVDSHFDVIIACDVIEHVVNPITFLRSLRGHLKTGGQAIITTGDADNWLWRIARSNFWYCFFQSTSVSWGASGSLPCRNRLASKSPSYLPSITLRHGAPPFLCSARLYMPRLPAYIDRYEGRPMTITARGTR